MKGLFLLIWRIFVITCPGDCCTMCCRHLRVIGLACVPVCSMTAMQYENIFVWKVHFHISYVAASSCFCVCTGSHNEEMSPHIRRLDQTWTGLKKTLLSAGLPFSSFSHHMCSRRNRKELGCSAFVFSLPFTTSITAPYNIKFSRVFLFSFQSVLWRWHNRTADKLNKKIQYVIHIFWHISTKS